MIAPTSVYQSSDLVPALRELFSQHPAAVGRGRETLARMLYVLCYLSYRPEVFEVEEALEALQLEGGIAA